MSGVGFSYALLSIAIVRKFKLSFKGMAEKYLVHRFKYYLHNSRPFKVPMQATVSILSHTISCFMYLNDSAFTDMVWFC